MNDLKRGDFVRGSVVRTNRTAEGVILDVLERTVAIDNGKGDRVMLDKQGIENIGIGAKIKARRTELKMSQAVVAAAVGVKQSTYSQWETGTFQPPADRISALEGALDISLAGLSEKAFNGVTVSYDPSVITKKPLREKDILDTEGNFKQPVPAFKEPRAIPALPPEVCEKLDAQMDVAAKAIKSELKGDDMTVSIETGTIKFEEPTKEILINGKPLRATEENTTLDLDEILTTFFPRFGNFHADYQLAGAFELLLQAEAGNACLDDLRKAREKLDKAIACLEK